MSERNRATLNSLSEKPGNDVCADCHSKEDIDWASCNLGVFLCKDCAGVHRSLGVDISRVRSVNLDNWDDDQVKKMSELGNDLVNSKYEQHLPMYYKRPSKNDVEILRMQFIRAKYERKEFMYPDKQTPYSETKKEGILMKKGKNERAYKPRKFIVNSKNNIISYFNKDPPKGPKDTFTLDEVNFVFVPEKIGNPNGFQITYLKNGLTRNLFLYCDDSKEAVDWFTVIRSAKLERRRLAFPDRAEEELCKDLTQNFQMEGYLMKKGPNNEPYKRRWFTLDRRKLMYATDPLSAVPKGEIFIGDTNFSVSLSSGERSDMCEFLLETPGRTYELKADGTDDRDKWITALKNVINTPQTPSDRKMFNAMVPRK